MWKMGKLHLYSLLRTLTKWAKYFWSPHCCEEWIKCNFVTLSWTHSLSELTALFYMRNDDVTIWTTYITHSGQCWIPIAIFRYGLTLFVYLPPVVIFPLFWHFERDTLNKWYFLQMFVWFWYFFPSHLSIKIGKLITHSEGTSACMCLIWEGKGHFACWPNDSFGVK